MDVSSEADAIRDDARHQGLYVNNNEKCDDFEVIDDGSQQGGMRNFEDKSFERSGRSSLLSSVRTDLVSDSIESEVPLEISMDVEKTTANNKDDYDIVQMDDESKAAAANKKPTLLDINKLAAGRERLPSPGPESNINVNKYLFSDNDDDGNGDDEPETSGTFNIDMYFATEEKTNSNKEEQPMDSHAEETTNQQLEERLNSSVEPPPEGEDEDDDDDTLPEIVSQEESEDKSSSTVILTEQDDSSSSPFLEVKSQVNPATNKNPVPSTTSDHVRTLNDNEEASEDESAVESPLNSAFVSSDLPGNQETSVVVQDTDVLNSSSNSAEETSEASVVDKRPLSLNIDQDIRKSVEDLYEQILSEGSQGDPMSDDDEGTLPADATFGEPIGLTASPVDGPPKKKEGWLVRVESFSTPATRTPQIKVIKDDDASAPKTGDVTVVLPEEQHDELTTTNPTTDVRVENHPTSHPIPRDADSPAPVPKERKKKKKKKEKRKSVEIVEEDNDSASAADSPAVSPSKRLDHSDIPKQFLDASNTLAGDSYSLSDTSDVEQEVLEDGTTINKKRSGSKKKSKESCKTQ